MCVCVKNSRVIFNIPLSNVDRDLRFLRCFSGFIKNIAPGYTEIQKNIYGGKIYYLENPETIWYAGGKVNLTWGHISHRGLRKSDADEFSVCGETDYITGCCLFTSMEVIDKLNGFDERFNMYGEDVDLCLRARQQNINCYYWPNAKLMHSISASVGGNLHALKLIRKYWSLIKLWKKYNLENRVK